MHLVTIYFCLDSERLSLDALAILFQILAFWLQLFWFVLIYNGSQLTRLKNKHNLTSDWQRSAQNLKLFIQIQPSRVKITCCRQNSEFFATIHCCQAMLLPILLSYPVLAKEKASSLPRDASLSRIMAMSCLLPSIQCKSMHIFLLQNTQVDGRKTIILPAQILAKIFSNFF